MPTTAQTQFAPANTPLRATFTASPDQVTGYRCYVGGKQVSQVDATTLECQLGALPPGDYLIEVDAFNQFGSSERVGVTLTTGNRPGPPSGIEISVTTTATLRVQPNPDGSFAVNVVKVASDVSQQSTITAPSTGR